MSHRNRLIVAASLLLASSIGAIGALADDTAAIYRETFNIPDVAQGDPSGLSGSAVAAAQGWKAFRNGGPYNAPCSSTPLGQTCLQAFAPGSTQLSSVGNPAVFEGAGSAFYSPFRISGISIYTEEYPLSLDLLKRSKISFESRVDGTGTDKRRLLLRIGDTWYFSDTVLNQTAASTQWQTFEFDNLGDELFGTKPADACESPTSVPPCGPRLPSTFDTLLPDSGLVDAIGLFVDFTNSERQRFDNYTIAVKLDSFADQGECISTLIQVQCKGLTAEDRKICNRTQQNSCKAFFEQS